MGASGRTFRARSPVDASRSRTDQWTQSWPSGSSTNRTSDRVPSGTPCQASPGEMSAPWQVNSTGIGSLAPNAVEVIVNGAVLGMVEGSALGVLDGATDGLAAAAGLTDAAEIGVAGSDRAGDAGALPDPLQPATRIASTTGTTDRPDRTGTPSGCDGSPGPATDRSPASGTARSPAVEEAEAAQVVAQRRGIHETDRPEPEIHRGLDVPRLVVDEHRRGRFDPEPIDEHREEPRIRLHEPLLTGDHDAVEPLEERVARPGERERLGRPVAEGEEPEAPSVG